MSKPPLPRQPARSLHAAKPNSHLRYGIAGEVHASAEIFDDRCMTLRSSFIMGLRAEEQGCADEYPGDQFPKPCRAPLRCTTVTPNVRFVLNSGANADLSGGPSCAKERRHRTPAPPLPDMGCGCY